MKSPSLQVPLPVHTQFQYTKTTKGWGRDGGGYNESNEGKRFTHGANMNNHRETIHGIKELGVLIYTNMQKVVT